MSVSGDLSFSLSRYLGMKHPHVVSINHHVQNMFSLELFKFKISLNINDFISINDINDIPLTVIIVILLQNSLSAPCQYFSLPAAGLAHFPHGTGNHNIVAKSRKPSLPISTFLFIHYSTLYIHLQSFTHCPVIVGSSPKKRLAVCFQKNVGVIHKGKAR